MNNIEGFNAFHACAQRLYKVFEASPETTSAALAPVREARDKSREYLDDIRYVDQVAERTLLLVKQINTGELPVNTAVAAGRNNMHLNAVVTALNTIRLRLTAGGKTFPGDPPQPQEAPK